MGKWLTIFVKADKSKTLVTAAICDKAYFLLTFVHFTPITIFSSVGINSQRCEYRLTETVPNSQRCIVPLQKQPHDFCLCSYSYLARMRGVANFLCNSWHASNQGSQQYTRTCCTAITTIKYFANQPHIYICLQTTIKIHNDRPSYKSKNHEFILLAINS